MSEQALSPIAAEPRRRPRPRRRATWRGALALAFEFLALFALAMWLNTSGVLAGKSAAPDPLWLPVVVLSLQYGLGAGIAASLVADACRFWGGLPPATLSEDLYTYVGRIGAEPIAWTCAALLIGHIRTRQIAQQSELKDELAEQQQQCAAVVDRCEDLRKRADMLERHIAANDQSSPTDIAEAIAGLHSATWENFAERLTHFINVMAGSSEFALYLVRNGVLRLVLQPEDPNVLPAEPVVDSGDGLFEAVLQNGRTLLASRPDDRELIGERGALFTPVIEPGSGRTIGMLSIGGADLTDFPEDIERRAGLAASEVARFLGRVILIDAPRGPDIAAPRIQPGERLQQAHTIAQRLTSKKKAAK